MIAARTTDMNSRPCQTTDSLAKIDQDIDYARMLPSCVEISCAPPSNKKRRSYAATKKVRFQEKVEVAFFESLSKDELQACWYQREDNYRVMRHNKVCLLAFRKLGSKASRLSSSEKYCIRGLENHLSSKSSRVIARRSRNEHIRSVIMAQKSTMLKGSYNAVLLAETLRILSLLSSRGKVRDALQMAANDSLIWHEEYRQFL